VKIVLTTRQFSPCVGGTETSVLEFALGLVRAGHQVSVITLNRNIWNGDKLPPHDTVQGIEVFRVAYVSLGLRPLPLCNPLWLLKLLRSADIVHNHDIRFLFETCLLARALYGVPLVIGSHGFILHQKKLLWLKRAVFRYYYLPLFRFIDCLQAVSVQDFKRVEAVLPADKLVLVPGGVNAAQFSGVEGHPQPHRLLYFGRVDTHKGLDLLFETLARMRPDVTLRIVFASARKECQDALQALAEKLKIENQVQWLGKKNLAELREELGAAHLVVFPSRYEGFGLTLLEAMAAGTVVVGNTIEAFGDIVDNGRTGFLVDFANTEVAAVQLESILGKSPEELANVASAAASLAAEQDWSKRVQALLDVYARLSKVGSNLPNARNDRTRHKNTALPIT
jgi:alpha-1,3-mannosyltransferase